MTELPDYQDLPCKKYVYLVMVGANWQVEKVFDDADKALNYKAARTPYTLINIIIRELE